MSAWLYADKGRIGIANNSSDRTMKQVDPGNGMCRVHPKFNRGRKLNRAGKSQSYSVGLLVLLFFGIVGFLLLGWQDSSERKEFFDNQNSGQDSIWAETKQIITREGDNEIFQQKDGRKLGRVLVHGSGSWASKVLGFGQGSTGSGQDSRYWDKDDRRRDEKYENDFEILNADVRSVSKPQKIGLGDEEEDAKENGFNSHGKSGVNKDIVGQNTAAAHSDLDKGNKSIRMSNGQDLQNESLYNEQGRNELKIYEAQYEADLKEEQGLNKTGYDGGLVNADNGDNTGEDIAGNLSLIGGRNRHSSQTQNSKQTTTEYVYGDGDLFTEKKFFDVKDQHPRHVSGMEKDHRQDYKGKNIIETQINMSLKNSYNSEVDNNNFSVAQNNKSFKKSDDGNLKQRMETNFEKESSAFISSFDQENAVKEIHEWSQNLSRREKLVNLSEIGTWKMDSQKRSTNSSRSKRRKPPSLPCEVGFLNSTEELQEPEENVKFANFSLEYVQREEKPDGVDTWEPRFAGHQSLDERENSFYARDQKLHCGFVKGSEGSLSTGFDLYEKDAEFLRTCHIAVSSCIFGNSDNIRAPTRKKVSQASKKIVCFVMFIDEKTLETLSLEGQKPDENGQIGLWKIVVVRNVPYTDMRRNGKIPKFLSHRLFPSARYSIWIDSKMRLNSDPLNILEYFLWRGGFEYAISNHYDRHCVWEEVMQNKRLNKFNHTLIDEQFSLYQVDGLTKFNASDPNTLLPSYVPEGSFIVRAHSPMSNLFSCLWFNEVDRFTPRDQLSFAYTFLKLRRMNPETHLWLNMFKDCERRFLSKLFHHRTE
ncbi:uncharacterized protein LOC131039369 isoform X1 [Cryptomeria japonica]|uniref:uncharacterized protein LOC131039369 isoform X1 n=2 Tax=Cryptomeria japonica TaxID=3369 RepID=UPI0025AC6D5B|nr:uncharacterized protein LOC131039369 isoform X1 [Cryptomeria japonica]